MPRQKGRAEVERNAQQLKRLDVTYIPVANIQANKYNPNRQSEHDFNLLKKSMDEDGFTQPVVAIRIDATHLTDPKFSTYTEGDIVIVDGEHRWRAAYDLGLKEIPVVIVPMSVEQMRIATLRHNRARGTEDYELSADVLRDLEALGALGWAQDSLQITDAELTALLSEEPAPLALADDDFSESWVPGTETRDNLAFRTDSNQSLTPQAVASIRQAEQLALQAHTEEERVQARKDADIYRVVLTFSGEEGRTVKAVLGTTPATTLVTLCTNILANQPAE
jgi:ParB-like chromosome segregation protein Spo0J